MHKDTKISEFLKLGYRFEITEEENNKKVKITANFLEESYQVPHTYSKDWSNYQIKLDLINDLIRHFRLCVVEKLEHCCK